MKTFLQILSALVVSTGLTVGVAAADSSCTVDNTGPNSTNECSTTQENTVKVKCVNDIYVVNDNSQGANSGNADSTGNTSGGGATSGSAVNENGDKVNIGASCESAQVATANPTPTPTAPTPTAAGGMGGEVAAAPAPAAAKAAQVTALPETGSNTALKASIAGLVLLGSSMFVSRIGIFAYRRHLLK